VSDVTVRVATLHDAEALLEIYRPFVQRTTVSFELEPPPAEEFALRIEKALARFAWLVAESGGRTIGYAYGTQYRERAAYRWATEVSAYVHPGHQGRGVGRALYERLFDALALKGYCTAYAGIALPNEASVGLHQAVGFEPVGVFRRAGRKFGRWHDVAWFQRTLRDEPPEC
jgi:phosphinothricin acetyltransferase